jgi:hypothetical protein
LTSSRAKIDRQVDNGHEVDSEMAQKKKAKGNEPMRITSLSLPILCKHICSRDW